MLFYGISLIMKEKSNASALLVWNLEDAFTACRYLSVGGT